MLWALGKLVIMIRELNLNNLIKLNQKIHLNGSMLLYEGGYSKEGTGLGDPYEFSFCLKLCFVYFVQINIYFSEISH